MSQKIKGIVWIDLEMTGLNPQTDKIIEIGTIVTDFDMNLLDKGLEFQIHTSQETLDLMSPDVVKLHTKNGLIERCKASDITQDEAEQKTLDYIKKYFDHFEAPLAGNSIWVDRSFLSIHMPLIDKHLHYRVLDSSTLKQLYTMYSPEIKYQKPEGDHTALSDIKASINEMKYYRDLIFKN